MYDSFLFPCNFPSVACENRTEKDGKIDRQTAGYMFEKEKSRIVHVRVQSKSNMS